MVDSASQYYKRTKWSRIFYLFYQREHVNRLFYYFAKLSKYSNWLFCKMWR